MDRTNNTNSDALISLFRTWIDNESKLNETIDNGSCSLHKLKPIVEHVHRISVLALEIIEAIINRTTLSSDEIESSKGTLQNAQEIIDELVVSSAYPVEKLFFSASWETKDWMEVIDS